VNDSDVDRNEIADNNAMHAKPDLRVELEPKGHFFRLGDLCRYPAWKFGAESKEMEHSLLGCIAPLVLSIGGGQRPDGARQI
jgi:hypothetical protein